MSARFEQAELLKKQYTDKFVVVKSGVPELKRFQGLTGVVKTVNMSCRALVMFDGPADIGWYDIDPAYLTLVDAPAPKKVEAKAEKSAPTEKAAATPAAKAPAGEKKLSPLEMIRQQGAKTAGAASAPSAAVPPAAAPTPAGKKLSPLEMIRQQAALKAAGGAAPAAEPTPAPVAETASAPAVVEVPAPVEVPKPGAPAADGKKLSPIEQIRLQAAARANK